MTLTNYWWLLIWLFTGGALLAYAFPKKAEIVCGRTEERWNIAPAILLVVPYIIWAGFRSDSYGDTMAYRQTFFQAPGSFMELPGYLAGVSKDKGFAALTVILKSIIGNSDTAYFLIFAIVQLVILALVFRKYSCNYWMSFFLFVAGSEYISWCHNGMRQFTAVMLIFAATRLLEKKRYIALTCIVLLAATLHASAILMLPVIFIVNGKAWNKRTLLCIIASVVILFFVDQFTDTLDFLVSNTQYSNMVTDWKEWEDDGTNPIRVLVYSIPMILAFIGRRQIREEDNPFINILVNFSILTCSISLISMVTSGIFLGRLIIYPGIYSTCLLLPWEVKKLFTAESSKVVSIFIILGYMAYFFYQMHFSWALI